MTTNRVILIILFENCPDETKFTQIPLNSSNFEGIFLSEALFPSAFLLSMCMSAVHGSRQSEISWTQTFSVPWLVRVVVIVESVQKNNSCKYTIYIYTYLNILQIYPALYIILICFCFF